MSRSLKIALSMRISSAIGYDEQRDTLAQDWFHLLDDWRALPICIPNTYEDIESLIDMADLVILTGGNDVCLDSHNNEILDLEGCTKDRDIQEYKIIDICIKKKIPLLGVCRGMQLINYKFGGCLVPVDAHKHVNRQHKLKVFKNNILKQREFVNSYHNYSIDFDSLSDDLDVLAISSDGEVEAFMHKKYSIFGMMWHPERNKPFCEADKELVMKLINGTY